MYHFRFPGITLCLLALLIAGCPPAPVQGTVPDVSGLTESAARTAIGNAGLSVGTVTEEYSSTVADGNVISQDPTAGTSVQLGANVDLVISKGVEPGVVPDVVGQSQTDAESAITTAGLTVGAVTQQYSDTVDAGDVISQNPTAGTSVAPGSAVALVVSEGPERVPGEMVSIPPVSFDMGDATGAGWTDELPVHTVALSAYEIGKYEVTNGEYVDVLNWALNTARLTHTSGDVSAYGQTLLTTTAQFCQISYSGSEFSVETRDGKSMAYHPVVQVTWYGAAVYCNWLSEYEGLQPCYNTTTWTCDLSQNGYHLPTEAQWEQAAAWDSSGAGYHYMYSHSADTISLTVANYSDGSTYANPMALASLPYTCTIGYFTGMTSPIGCFNMSGNVREWCNDWYQEDYYSSSPATDPEGPTSGTSRVFRGGDWYDLATYCRSASRGYDGPSSSDSQIGFRIAK